jgi:hypothetical protein
MSETIPCGSWPIRDPAPRNYKVGYMPRKVCFLPDQEIPSTSTGDSLQARRCANLAVHDDAVIDVNKEAHYT